MGRVRFGLDVALGREPGRRSGSATLPAITRSLAVRPSPAGPAATFPRFKPQQKADAEERLKRPLKVLDDHLAAHTWLVADRFTIADLNVASALGSAGMAGVDLSAFANVTKWLAACNARPAAQ